MGTDRKQLPKIPGRYRLSRLPHNGMRRHLRRTGEQHDNSGQPAQRDFLPCSLYRYPLFLPVQIRRIGKIHFQRSLEMRKATFYKMAQLVELFSFKVCQTYYLWGHSLHKSDRVSALEALVRP